MFVVIVIWMCGRIGGRMGVWTCFLFDMITCFDCQTMRMRTKPTPCNADTSNRGQPSRRVAEAHGLCLPSRGRECVAAMQEVFGASPEP